ncbi:Tannase/feruloyl esterase [Xylogone sp. PMI_703]|nr:Tannase/feruloyl esterase [Xylogone sp. PMI_703]
MTSSYMGIYVALVTLIHAVWAVPTSPLLGARSNSISSCSASSIDLPPLLGIEVISLSAAEIHNYSYAAANISNLDFCLVNVTYTHPGRNDTVLTQVWLPLQGWNSRFQGTGGGGYAMGLFDQFLAPAVSQGYAAASTNGGVSSDEYSPATWALTSPGNVNYGLLVNFASQCLNDMPLIGKAVTASFYGTPAQYSYWNGCSTGGRQGVLSAQRYPTNYDGILAAAPAIQWTRFIPGLHWPQVVMHEEGVYPPLCEIAEVTAAAVRACDEIDGVADGVIAAPGLCRFDPHSLVGQSFSCNGEARTISSQTATVVQKIWQGPQTRDGSFIWYGYNPDVNLSSVANTTQYPNGTGASNPFLIGETWISYFLSKDPTLDVSKISYEDYGAFTHQSIQEYNTIIGTDDPDLSAFKAAGGKMITWHGVSDELIPTNNTIRYYETVKSLDIQVEDYYRVFLAPGVGHCGGGVGFYPDDALGALVQWVENGTAPVTLPATSLTSGRKQPLCKYPLVAMWDGVNDSALESSYECVASFALS